MVFGVSCSPENIWKILSGENIGTVFKAKERTMGDRKWWIRHGLHVYGKIYVDQGAVRAIQGRNSLFAAGITKVEGQFHSQTAVSVISQTTGEEIGRGIVNYSALEVDRVKGRKSNEMEALLGYAESDCIINRQNLALTKEPTAI